MIDIRVELDETGALFSVTASGHAGCGTRGHDIVCAAVTILLRTTVSALADMHPEVQAGQRGFLSFSICRCSFQDIPRLQYAADFLWLGISSLAAEYPHAICCKKTENTRRLIWHGSEAEAVQKTDGIQTRNI
ncbi:MAG: ribosomal-processing cysteine protease Prp [Treponema sp.]